MDIHYNSSQIRHLDKFYRANLINSIVGIKQANLVGTISNKKTSNLAIFSSAVHLGSNPSMVGIFSRPEINKPKQTMNNIINRKHYTLNHVNASILKRSHATSYKFDKDVSEFEKCNLEAKYIPNFKAPFVAEAEIGIGLEYLNDYKILENGVVMIIGEVRHIRIRKTDLVQNNGEINLQSARSIGVSGNNSYYDLMHRQTLDYIKSTEELPPYLKSD